MNLTWLLNIYKPFVHNAEVIMIILDKTLHVHIYENM